MTHKTACVVLLIVSFTSRNFFTFGHIQCGDPYLINPNSKPKPNIDLYGIAVDGDPEGFVPGNKYTIILQKLSGSVQDFSRFILTVERSSGEAGTMIHCDPLTTFSQTCPYTIVEANGMPKSEVQVVWKAPEEGDECVYFKATVVISRELWYEGNGQLFREFCPRGAEEEQPEVLEECGACQEAKYEVTFEGLWTRNVFPNEFPANEWSTKFSTVIGASHYFGFDIWKDGKVASEGLKLLAETGNTTGLEDEIKKSAPAIRTIIKARGLAYPNINGRTVAVFRVDKGRHLVSLAASIIPSPDWFVGVSNYELCTPNNTWIESATYNLYPIDAGTDAGKSYTSPDEPLDEPQPVHRISSDTDEDSTSFYDPSGGKLPPIARLHLKRQKLFDKDCSEEPVDENCRPQNWTDWTSCSATCQFGIQYRTRVFYDQGTGSICKEDREKRPCKAAHENCVVTTADCALSDWSPWSSCSRNCGKGTKTRDRKFLYPDNKVACLASEEVSLEENEECFNPNQCSYEVKRCDNCNFEWGEWSPCNTTCGKGVKFRMATNFFEDDICRNCKNVEEVECEEVCDSGTQIDSENQVLETCPVLEWSKWSRCEPRNGICGAGMQKKEGRVVPRHKFIGSINCPDVIVKTRQCNKKCGKWRNTRELRRKIKIGNH